MTAERPHRPKRPARAMRAILAACCLAGTLGAAAAQEPSRLSEVYGDWTVNCASNTSNERVCFMVQTLADENQRRILQAEIRLDGDETQFALLAPLGVLLPAGVNTSIDGGPPQAMAFHTCLAAGCIVRSQLSAEEVANLRRGTEMVVRIKAADTGAELSLKFSLSGISAALNRLEKLSG